VRTHLISAGSPFVFSSENKKKIAEILKQYPPERKQSAVLPLLDLGQRQNQNWVSQEVVETIAKLLDMPVMRVFEVASFYTMFNLRPVGTHFIQVCRTTPCWLRGSDALKAACESAANCNEHGDSADGLFSLVEVECLGACVNAPVVQINDDFYEDLTPEKMTEIVKTLKAGKDCKPGPQTGRLHSAPEGYKSMAKGGRKNAE